MYINGVFVGSWSTREQFLLLVVHRFSLTRRLVSVVHGLYGTCGKCGGRTPKVGGRLLQGRTWDEMPPLQRKGE